MDKSFRPKPAGRMVVVYAYAAIGLLFLAVLTCSYHPKWWRDSGFVYRFQTLISGLIALLAAFITAGVVIYQARLGQLRDQRHDDLRKAATRATLPHMLDILMLYVDGCILTLNDIRAQASEGSILNGITFHPAPTLPFEIVDRLASAVETLDNTAAEAIAALLIDLQVQKARLEGNVNALGDPRSRLLVLTANIDTTAMDTGAIYARASILYPYARGEQAEARSAVTYAEVFSALNILHFDGLRFDFTFQNLANRGSESWRR